MRRRWICKSNQKYGIVIDNPNGTETRAVITYGNKNSSFSANIICSKLSFYMLSFVNSGDIFSCTMNFDYLVEKIIIFH